MQLHLDYSSRVCTTDITANVVAVTTHIVDRIAHTVFLLVRIAAMTEHIVIEVTHIADVSAHTSATTALIVDNVPHGDCSSPHVPFRSCSNSS